MKKQLLFTLAFCGALTFASAQTEISFDETGTDVQSFTVGQQDGDDLDEGILAATGTGVAVPNNNFMGIRSDTPTDDGATGTWTFTISTASTTPINTTLFLDMAKRPGCSVSGTVSVSGATSTSMSYAFATDGTDVSAVMDTPIQFESILSLVNGAPLTVTISLDEMLNVDNVATSIFRLENVVLERDGVLGLEDVSTQEIRANIFPNPAKNSFQIQANENIERVELYNITGRLVKTFEGEANYDISDLPSGIYLAQVKMPLGTQTLKVIKE